MILSSSVARAKLLLLASCLMASPALAQVPSQPVPGSIYQQPGTYQQPVQYGQPQSGSVDPASAAGLSMRIGELEERVRQLNGQVEQLSHMVRTLQGQQGGPSADAGSRSSATVMSQPQGTGDADFYEGAPGRGEPPQILGQLPAGGLDLSGALDQPTGGYGAPSAQGGQGGGTQLAAAPSGDPRSDYDTAYGHVLRGEFDVAEASFRQFVDTYPDNELTGNAQYWLGESLFARGRYRDAADAFLAGYTEHPESAKAPDSLFKLGMSLKELGERDAACASLSEISRKFPEAPAAVRERAQSEMDKSGC